MAEVEGTMGQLLGLNILRVCGGTSTSSTTCSDWWKVIGETLLQKQQQGTTHVNVAML